MYFGRTVVSHGGNNCGNYKADVSTSDAMIASSLLRKDVVSTATVEEKVIMPPNCCSFDCNRHTDKYFTGDVITFGDNGDMGKEAETKEEIRGIAMKRHKKILSKWVRSLQTCEIGILKDTKNTDKGDDLGLWKTIISPKFPNSEKLKWCNDRNGKTANHEHKIFKDNIFDEVTPTSPLIFTPDEYVEKPYRIDNHSVYTMDSLGRDRPFNMIIPSDGVGESMKSNGPIDTITNIPRGVTGKILTNHSRRRFDGIVQNIHPKLYCQLMEGENVFEDNFYEERILSPLEIQTRLSNSDVSNHSDNSPLSLEKVEQNRHRYAILPQANRDVSQLRQKVVKTKLCVHQIHGSCPRGRDCTFAHSAEELKKPPNFYKTRLCFNYCRTAYCWKGDKCTFAHGLEEIRMAPQEDASDAQEANNASDVGHRSLGHIGKETYGINVTEDRRNVKEDLTYKEAELKKISKKLEDIAEPESSGGSTSDADEIDYEELKSRLLESVPRLGKIQLIDAEFNKILEEENKFGAVLQRT